MNRDTLETILVGVREGRIGVAEALERLKGLPYEDMGYAKLDHHRQLRKGVAEVVFCEGKTVEQAADIAKRLYGTSPTVLLTRASEEICAVLKAAGLPAEYHRDARIIVVGGDGPPANRGTILVVSAGTADIPVAEEAAVTARALGNPVQRLYDVGVAGIHRLLDARADLEKASVIIVVAGMEGALPSVIAGLVEGPVIAVPTSVGFGASFGGLAALLAMLNSCAPGVGVVNIDNGFGAACLAHAINRAGERLP